MKTKYWLFSILTISIAVAIYFFTKTPKPEYEKLTDLPMHPRGGQFAGSHQCMSCHKDIYEQHINTAHFKTSALADTTTVKGNFTEGKNTYQLNKNVLFKMVKTDSALFETIHRNGRQISNQKMEIVIGSGTKGQSYLTWRDSLLFQLQASYYTPTDKWTNSPGMPNRIRRNQRPIFGDCLECHATFAKSNTNYRYNAYETILFGIDCERCHNPAQEHVTYHTKNPLDTIAKHITSIKNLSRQQRLDACILCHSGLRQLKKPPFGFLTGDKLTDFSLPPRSRRKAYPDVHGNQYQLFSMSECFKQTQMDCTTCHNPHKKERGNFADFNSKCIDCHSTPDIACTENEEKKHAKNNNCIECHMPLLPSKILKVEVGNEGETTPLMVRTHHITKYIEELGS